MLTARIVERGAFRGPLLVAIFRGLVSDEELDALLAVGERDHKPQKPIRRRSLDPRAARLRLLGMQLDQARRERDSVRIRALNLEIAEQRIRPAGLGPQRSA